MLYHTPTVANIPDMDGSCGKMNGSYVSTTIFMLKCSLLGVGEGGRVVIMYLWPHKKEQVILEKLKIGHTRLSNHFY